MMELLGGCDASGGGSLVFIAMAHFRRGLLERALRVLVHSILLLKH